MYKTCDVDEFNCNPWSPQPKGMSNDTVVKDTTGSQDDPRQPGNFQFYREISEKRKKHRKKIASSEVGSQIDFISSPADMSAHANGNSIPVSQAKNESRSGYMSSVHVTNAESAIETSSTSVLRINREGSNAQILVYGRGNNPDVITSKYGFGSGGF